MYTFLKCQAWGAKHSRCYAVCSYYRPAALVTVIGAFVIRLARPDRGWITAHFKLTKTDQKFGELEERGIYSFQNKLANC